MMSTTAAMELLLILKQEYDTLPEPVRNKLGEAMDIAMELQDTDMERIVVTLRPLVEELKKTHPRLAELLK